MKQILIILLILLSFSTFAQFDKYLLSYRFTATGQEFFPVGTISDNQDNIYTIISHRGAGSAYIGDSIYTPVTTAYNSIIIKVSKNGDLLWSRHITSVNAGNVNPVSIDIVSGYLYVTIHSTATPVITTGSSIITLGNNDILLYKLNLDGTLIWGKNICYGATDQSASKTSMLATNNGLILSGTFISSATFLDGDTTITSSRTRSQPFITMLDTSGHFIWIKTLINTSTASNSSMTGITLMNNKIYVSGNFADSLKTDIGNLKTYGSNDAFFYCMDLQGSPIWLRQIGGDGSELIFHLASEDGYIYSAGRFSSTLTVIDSTETLKATRQLSTNGSSDIMYLSYDSLGVLQFLKGYGSTSNDLVLANMVRYKSLSIFSFVHLGSFTFDSFPLVNTGTSAGAVVILKNNIASSVITITGLSATSSSARDICFNASGDLICAFFTNSATYSINDQVFNALGSRDLIFVKFISTNKIISNEDKVLKLNNKTIRLN